MDPKLLEILVCPLCKGPLVWRKDAAELLCKADRLGFPVRDGIPVMLEEEARVLPTRHEIETFLTAVDGIRADVDRLAARIQRLKDNFPQ